MIKQFFKYRDMSRTETLTATVLATILTSEVLVIFLLNTNYGDFLANEINAFFRIGIQTAKATFQSAYEAMGIWLFVFLTMAIIVIWITLDLIGCWKGVSNKENIIKKYKILDIIKEISTPTGMLGTIIPMIYALKSIKVGLPTAHPLYPMISKLSIALMTTACGLGMFIATYLCRKVFMEFLLEPKMAQIKSGINPGKDFKGEEESINRIKSDEEA